MRESNSYGFAACHPMVNFVFFAVVITMTMTGYHPIILLTSLISASIYYIHLNGKKNYFASLKWLVPIFVIAAIMNPLFNHQGGTILLYFPNGNPLTLESIAFGAAAGAMLYGVICWFFCYNVIMTSDKFIYLFGRVIPTLSLVFSMALSFIPRMKKQLSVITDCQKMVYKNQDRTFLQKIQIAGTSASSLITWALENSVDTADSMRARGYGTRFRTAFSIYTFSVRDIILLSGTCIMAYVLLLIRYFDGGEILYFPILQWGEKPFLDGCYYIIFVLLCNCPFCLDRLDERKWV